MTKEERRELVRKLNSEGLNDVLIARQLGVSKPVICEDRKAMGIPALAQGWRQVLVTVEQLREWSAAGLTRKEMAQRCGASRMTITRKLWEMRLKDERAAKIAAGEPEGFEEDDEPVPEIVGDELFLSAFKATRVAMPVNSRRAETSNLDGRIYGLPAPAFPVSSIYGA